METWRYIPLRLLFYRPAPRRVISGPHVAAYCTR
nr:MAG TPA: hypothetical protein [Caudoviricetes sp.]